MIEILGAGEAQALFEKLSREEQLSTLSPAYVIGDASRSIGLEPGFICYREDALFWMHGVHKSCVPGEKWFDLQSPYGYGGPLANVDDSAFLSRAWTTYQRWCFDADVLAEFVRFHPLARNWRYYPGDVRDNRSTVAVPLQISSDLLRVYSTRCRTAIRKAQCAGLSCARIAYLDNVQRFARFYRDGMAAIGAEKFYLFDDNYFLALATVPGVRLFACLKDDSWLSAGLFFRGSNALEYHLSATTQDGRELGATNLLLHAAAEDGRAEGLTWLYLGGGTDGREDNSLLFFKAGFSKLRFPFRTGFSIHNREAYSELKSRHCNAKSAPSRILFYR